jgi:hypothetical protein
MQHDNNRRKIFDLSTGAEPEFALLDKLSREPAVDFNSFRLERERSAQNRLR